jgi:hypothetical protein
VVKLFVEGGGDSPQLKTECREALATFLTKASMRKRPRVVACGGRRNAYEDYCTAIANGESALLLVDSEAPVDARFQSEEDARLWQPWGHLRNRIGDEWEKPANAADIDCHLMVQIMETWFLCDPTTLKNHFGKSFKQEKLPAISTALETLPKADIYDGLKQATRHDKKRAPYGKGPDAFKILRLLDPNLVQKNCPWAARFIDAVTQKME